MEDGYPTEEELELIRNWPLGDQNGLLKWLEDNWHFGDWGFRRGEDYLELHTGGWSGNEEIIGALQESRSLFWLFNWQRSERGGHYYFTLPTNKSLERT